MPEPGRTWHGWCLFGGSAARRAVQERGGSALGGGRAGSLGGRRRPELGPGWGERVGDCGRRQRFPGNREVWKGGTGKVLSQAWEVLALRRVFGAAGLRAGVPRRLVSAARTALKPRALGGGHWGRRSGPQRPGQVNVPRAPSLRTAEELSHGEAGPERPRARGPGFALPGGCRTPWPPLALTRAPSLLSGTSSLGGPCCSQPCVLPPRGPRRSRRRPE